MAQQKRKLSQLVYFMLLQQNAPFKNWSCPHSNKIVILTAIKKRTRKWQRERKEEDKMSKSEKEIKLICNANYF